MEEFTKELTKEQLKEKFNMLLEQRNQLIAKIQEMNYENAFKRLDYLFKVVENQIAFNEEFVAKCVSEIQDIMTVENTTEDTKGETNTTE